MSALGIDGALVSRSQAGDEEAITELARQVRPLAQRYASRFFSDPARAEDLAQTAMMKAFARVGDVRSPEAFQAWLLRITRNECLNELARQRVPQVPISTLEDQGSDIEAPAGGDTDPEEALVRVQLQSLVRQVITTLPTHYRRTLTMRALEDRSYEEISEELEVPVTVARLWYCRARKRFRQAFVDAMVARRGVSPECQAMGGAIAELIEGTLARTRRDEVQGHLAGCHVCRQTEDELRSTAFRAPARALLLGLGALRVPRRLARRAGSAARGAHWTARLALGTAGTATVLVAAGAPSGVAAHSAAATPDTGSAAASLDVAPAAGPADAPVAQPAALLLSAAAPGTSTAPGLQLPLVTGGAGLLGSLDGLVVAVEGIDLGSLPLTHLVSHLTTTARAGLTGSAAVAPLLVAITSTASQQAPPQSTPPPQAGTAGQPAPASPPPTSDPSAPPPATPPPAPSGSTSGGDPTQWWSSGGSGTSTSDPDGIVVPGVP